MDDKKTCSKCGETFPLTEEHWHRDKTHGSGFKSQCRTCRGQVQQAQRKARRDVPKVSKDPVLQQARVWALNRLIDAHELEYRRLVASRLETVKAPQKWITIT